MMKNVIFILFLGSLSWAKPAYYNMLLAQYPGARIAQTVKCQVCHNGMTRNAYGNDFSREKFTHHPWSFKNIENLDSDKDGQTNVVEIMNGTNPGIAGR